MMGTANSSGQESLAVSATISAGAPSSSIVNQVDQPVKLVIILARGSMLVLKRANSLQLFQWTFQATRQRPRVRKSEK
jgi:hypothetical protein